MKKKRFYQLSLSIFLLLIAYPAKAQISGEFQAPSGNTGGISQSANRNTAFPTTQTPTTTNPFGTNNNPNNGFPSFPNNGTANNGKWNFSQGTSTYFNSTNTFGNNSTTFFTNGSSPFGNGSNQECGVSVYAEGVGGKESTNSSLPNEINLNESGFSVRAGVKWNPDSKCVNPEDILEIERMKINAGNRDTCTKGMMTMIMNGVSIPEDIKTWCNSMLDKDPPK